MKSIFLSNNDQSMRVWDGFLGKARQRVKCWGIRIGFFMEANVFLVFILMRSIKKQVLKSSILMYVLQEVNLHRAGKKKGESPL